jgi:very-short-patch-repair endonuclease
VLQAWSVERAVDEALRRKLVSLRSLARVAKPLDHRGRRRSTVMRDILERRLPGYEPGESAPERRIADLLVRSGLPAPKLQHRVSVGGRRLRIDLAYPDAGIAIEYDGWSVHSSRSAFDHDRTRANDLVLLGMKVLRFTSASSDQQIVDTVTAALTRASVS